MRVSQAGWCQANNQKMAKVALAVAEFNSGFPSNTVMEAQRLTVVCWAPTQRWLFYVVIVPCHCRSVSMLALLCCCHHNQAVEVVEAMHLLLRDHAPSDACHSQS